MPEDCVPHDVPPSTGEEPETAPARGSQDASPGASSCSDRTDFPQQAGELQLAHAELRRQPEIREELVADLKRRLQGGAFKVDGERVAERLLQEMDFG